MPGRQTRRWIFIRGLARHSLHWGPFLEVFRRNFPEDEIELLDVRGNGVEAHIPSYLSIEDNVRDLRNRSQLLKKGPVHLLSISLGSMMAISWEHEFPQDIASLTCINTSDNSHSHFYDRLRPENYLRMVDVVLNFDNTKRVERKIMQMVAPHCQESEFWINEYSKSPQTSHQNLVRQLYAALRFKLPSEPPRCTSLLLVGKGDTFVSPKCTERIAQMWKIEPRSHPTAGHDIPVEDPQWVCDQIKDI